jgi:hypothetical protein
MALDLIEEFENVVRAFERERIEYAVCGGLAMTIHGHVRATIDIDLLIDGNDLSRALEVTRSCGFDIPARKMIFGLRSGTPREVQRVSKLDPDTNELLTVDLLLIGPGYERVWQTKTTMPWKGTTISVVSRDGLATMKKIAGRPQDLADIAKLEGTDDEEA